MIVYYYIISEYLKLIWIILPSVVLALLCLGAIFLYVISYKIRIFEQRIISVFVSRSDIFPSLYEVCRGTVSRQSEIFHEAMELRKKEFIMTGVSTNLEAFLELESKFHHEINFIFQVCNKNPSLLKNKNFLYIRDVVIDRSQEISKMMKKYKKIIEIYNKIITIKNYTVIGLILPFQKKPVL